MKNNKYFKLWISAISLHALHQLEESIGFFHWYVDYASKMPPWVSIISLNNAKTLILHPEYFIFASIAQIFFVLLLALVFRHQEKITKILIFFYLLGIAFFLLWHIVSSYIVHSYAPVMVTCLGGLFLIPVWMYKLFQLSRSGPKIANDGKA